MGVYLTENQSISFRNYQLSLFVDLFRPQLEVFGKVFLVFDALLVCKTSLVLAFLVVQIIRPWTSFRITKSIVYTSLLNIFKYHVLHRWEDFS